jgi:hypothetical protein
MNLEQQLHLAFAPCEPGPDPMAAVMARLSRRHGPGRPIIISSLLVIAAAAAMLAALLMDQSALQPLTIAPPHDFALDNAVVAGELPLVPPLPESVPQTPVLPKPVPAIRPFTVAVQLQN